MQLENNKVNMMANTSQRKALVVDEDKDRYRRKERNTVLKGLGYKVYPVLRMPDARGRCRPGAFELIVVNAGENANAALELCDHIKNCDNNQKLFLIADEKAGLPEREYLLRSWDELAKKIQPSGDEQNRGELVAA